MVPADGVEITVAGFHMANSRDQVLTRWLEKHGTSVCLPQILISDWRSRDYSIAILSGGGGNSLTLFLSSMCTLYKKL